MVYEFKLRIITAAFILFAVVGIIFAAGVGAGRFSVTQEADCPFDYKQMDIVPQTPTAYHHITGRRAPKHGAVVPNPANSACGSDLLNQDGRCIIQWGNIPLPPRRPTI